MFLGVSMSASISYITFEEQYTFNCYIRKKLKSNVYIITISINYHVELILIKNYLYETVNTYFVACSLCSLKIVCEWSFKTILYIINGRIEIVGILLARVKIYAASEKLSGCYTY